MRSFYYPQRPISEKLPTVIGPISVRVFVSCAVQNSVVKMPFWKKDKKNSSSKDEVDANGEKINYKARLEHKQYLVRRQRQTKGRK